MKTLNDYFEKIFCINLDKRFDRWKESRNEFEKHNLQVERITAIDGKIQNVNTNLKPGELGCILSHLKVIKKAKKDNLKNVLILEDDVEFDKNLNQLFFEYESQLPKWDMLYFGGNHSFNNVYMPKHNEPIKVSENVYKIRQIYTTHCYAIDNSLYDMIIDNVSQMRSPLDVIYSSIHSKCETYLLRPHLAWQRNDYSDIMEKSVDYSFLKK